MPRGGRRPGAGAPRGNFNGVRGGRSARFVAVYYVLVNHPDRRTLAEMLRQAGFFPPPSHKFNGDLRGAFRYLWSVWFDCADPVQSNAIKRGRPVRLPSNLRTPSWPRCAPLPEKMALTQTQSKLPLSFRR